MATTWTEQALDIMKNWADTQQKLWDSWFEAASEAGQSETHTGRDWFSQWQTATRKSLETWEELTRQTMEAQLGWAKQDQFSKMMESGSEEAHKLQQIWMDQTSKIMTSFSEAQRKLWEAWVDTATAMAGTETKTTDWFGSWQEMAEESLKSWDDLVKRSVDAQREWTRRWASAGESAQDQSGEAASSENQ